jgi:hypothetical protein
VEAEFEDIRTASGVRRKGAILKKTEVEEQVQQFNKTVILLAQYCHRWWEMIYPRQKSRIEISINNNQEK